MTDDELITRHIDPASYRLAPDDARLCEEGVPVWIVIAFDEHVAGDTLHVAETYHVSCDAVRAARAFYRRHRQAIDARIAYQSAIFA
jgi:hypothetical protein